MPSDPAGFALRHLVVEGPIGVGKTSLAQRLANALGGVAVLEQAGENPFLERFYREGTAVCRLNHVNIVQGIEVGKDKGRHFFAMEFVDGESVGAEIARAGKIAEPPSWVTDTRSPA